MSDALDYLLKARPDAMGHYFRFLSEAGKQLDPKTRSLISVITKVHAQTEAGFKQYLRRALRDGARPAEILDALLMAFPALGLTRIVWAVDIILKMDLPEFRPEALAGDQAWHRIGAIEQFSIDRGSRVEIEGQPLFVHRTTDAIRVFDAHCPHRDTPIPEAGLDGARVICSRHGWEFDLRSGQCVNGGELPLRELPAKIDASALLAFW
jgi:nitrite reductase/ring-hydroxylating ferredoxin subunit/alkylhydroperoxidase/carboxymuconolactone decarboxylase family protein YurZ